MYRGPICVRTSQKLISVTSTACHPVPVAAKLIKMELVQERSGVSVVRSKHRHKGTIKLLLR